MQVDQFDINDPADLEGFLEELEQSIFGEPISSDPDDQELPVALSLQPGTTKSVQGKTYVLNQNHRWTLRRQEGLFGDDFKPEPHSKEEYEDLTGEKRGPKTPVRPEKSQRDIFDRGKKSDLPGQNLLFGDEIESIRPATESERGLAASNGSTGYHRKARETVAKSFFAEEIGGITSHKIHGLMSAIDTGKPVRTTTTHQLPIEVVQWSTPGSPPTPYFAPKGTTPEDLGLEEMAVAFHVPNMPTLPRERKIYNFRGNESLKALQSTSATTKRGGGAQQYYIPDAAIPGVRLHER